MASCRSRPGKGIPEQRSTRQWLAWLLMMSAAGLSAAWLAPAAQAREELQDAPVTWRADDQRPVPKPDFREIDLFDYGIDASLSRPFARLMNPVRWTYGIGSWFGGQRVSSAQNINSLDEVLDSSWFTNRIGLYPMSLEELADGVGGAGPDTSAAWTVIKVKTEGVTMGFRIRDARGDIYLIKFDPPDFPGTTIPADVISARLLHAAGYNVPEDFVVEFSREQLRIGDGVTISTAAGKEPLTAARLDALLAATSETEGGRYRALASKFIPGRPVGPFDYKGTREEDPNDTVKHEDRRELRGLRVLAAWINHFDTKAQNTLDTYIGEDDEGYIRHYLIDFASTLGAQAGNILYKFGYEYSFDPGALSGRFFTLGAIMFRWENIQRPPGLAEVMYFDSENFAVQNWKPAIPNTAFANLNRRDAYWAAKVISAFGDEELAAIVAVGRYRDPEAARFVARILAERRDIIARHYFDRVPPLDFFALRDGAIVYHDLGVERGIYPAAETHYRVRAAAVNSERKAAGWSAWQESTETVVPPKEGALAAVQGQLDDEHQFIAVQFQVSRGSGWSRTTTVYLAPASGRVVALDR